MVAAFGRLGTTLLDQYWKKFTKENEKWENVFGPSILVKVQWIFDRNKERWGVMSTSSGKINGD